MIELLVVIAIIAILASLLLATLSRTKGKALSITCRSNLKQLALACELYTSANNDELPLNECANLYSTSSMDPIRQMGSPEGSWVTGHARWDTNTANIEKGVLFPYAGNASIYLCPADKSKAEKPDTWPGEKLSLPRTRSYSMSGSINCTKWRTDYSFKRSSSINSPGPAQVFVFLDVNEGSISDGHFKIVNPWELYGNKWISLPSDRHDRGCNLSFADGHVDPWKWKSPKKFINHYQSLDGAEDEKDFRKLQEGIKQSP